MIEGITIPNVSKVPVTISGDWSASPERDWQGVASAEKPIVAVAFLCWQNHVEWALSECSDKTSIKTRITLFPYDETGLDVQVNVSVEGGGQRYRSLVSSSTYRPVMPAVSTIETGTVSNLATIDGQPKLKFLCLFIAKCDIKVGRNRIWHLRPCFQENLPIVLREPLSYGRTGKM